MATFTESFDKGAGEGLGPDLTWSATDPGGNWETDASNRGIINGITAAEIFARAESADTGSNDMYVQLVIPDFGNASYGDVGLIVRMSSDRQTMYGLKRITASGGNPQWELHKYIAGVQSILLEFNLAQAFPETWRLEVEGDELRIYRGGVLLNSITDTDIPTGTFGGLSGFRNSTASSRRVIFDDFEVGSLASGVSGDGSHTTTLGGTSTIVNDSPDGSASQTTQVGATVASTTTSTGASQTTNVGAIASMTAGTSGDAVFIDEGTMPATAFATAFDGIRGPNDAEGYYTPLSSRGDYIYLAENTWAPNTLSGHISQIAKATHAEVAQANTGTQSWIPGTGVAVAGHASGASGVNGANGRVFAHRGGHAQSIDLRRETTAGTLSTMATLTDPAGCDVRGDYRRFWRAPDGTLWFYCRGNDGKGELYRWNEAGGTFTRIGGSGPFSDFGASAGSYSGNLTFDPDTGDIYVVTEALLTSTSGFPANFIGCAKSTDGGTTWTTLGGSAAALPLSLADHDTVAGGTASDEVVAAQITLDANGNPFIIFGWTNVAEGDQFLATWTARWNGSNWDYVRLYEQIGDGTDQLGQWQNSKIIPQITTHNGMMVIVMKEVGESVTQRLVVLVQYPTDAQNVWHRWVLHNDDLYTGAYIDMWSLPDDGLLRIYPVTSGDLVGYDQSSELWELDIMDVTEGATQTTTFGATASMNVAPTAGEGTSTTITDGTATGGFSLGATQTTVVDGVADASSTADATATGSTTIDGSATATTGIPGDGAGSTTMSSSGALALGSGATGVTLFGAIAAATTAGTLSSLCIGLSETGTRPLAVVGPGKNTKIFGPAKSSAPIPGGSGVRVSVIGPGTARMVTGPDTCGDDE